jgi:hypothetical protein
MIHEMCQPTDFWFKLFNMPTLYLFDNAAITVALAQRN